jgi:hypothetical protein
MRGRGVAIAPALQSFAKYRGLYFGDDTSSVVTRLFYTEDTGVRKGN